MMDKVQDLEIATQGDLTSEQAEKIRVIKAHYDALAICKEDLEQMIRELGREYQEQVKLIQNVPGFKDELSALRIISEIGADMSVFESAGNAGSNAGKDGTRTDDGG